MRRYVPALVWLVCAAAVIVVCIGLTGCASAPRLAVVEKPRFAGMSVTPHYKRDAITQRDVLAQCWVHAKFYVEALDPDGFTRTPQLLELEPFDLVQLKHQSVVNEDGIQTTLGDFAKDALAILEARFKQGRPGPLPVTRKALRTTLP